MLGKYTGWKCTIPKLFIILIVTDKFNLSDRLVDQTRIKKVHRYVVRGEKRDREIDGEGKKRETESEREVTGERERQISFFLKHDTKNMTQKA